MTTQAADSDWTDWSEYSPGLVAAGAPAGVGGAPPI